MSNTTTTLENARVSYARTGKTVKNTLKLTGLIQQLRDNDTFQSSFSFECYDKDVQAALLDAATKVEDKELSLDNYGTSADRNQNNLFVTVEGYFVTRKPKTDGEQWRTSFIVEKVTLVQK